MTAPSRYLPLRVPADLYKTLVELAAAHTGTNVSMIGRILLTEALAARAQRTPGQEPPPAAPTPAVTVTRTRAPAKAKTRTRAGKVDAARIIRDNRFPRESRQG